MSVFTSTIFGAKYNIIILERTNIIILNRKTGKDKSSLRVHSYRIIRFHEMVTCTIAKK